MALKRAVASGENQTADTSVSPTPPVLPGEAAISGGASAAASTARPDAGVRAGGEVPASDVADTGAAPDAPNSEESADASPDENASES